VNVSVRGGSRPILQRVSMRVTPGAKLAVVGASGSGKSALLEVIAGRLQPASGHCSAPAARCYRPSHASRFFARTVRGQLALDGTGVGPARQCAAARESEADHNGFADLGIHAETWELGLDTPVGRLGAQDRELLALRRTLFGGPPERCELFLLDMPPESALPTVLSLTATVVCVLPPQQAQHAANFDEVLLLDSGRVVSKDLPVALQGELDELAGLTRAG